MNCRVIILIKNFLYTFSSDLISMFISTIVILIIPKFIGLKEYGYWQLYLFYSSYVGFLHFGWNDGIYLRYGGKHYEDLEKGMFFSQFWMLFILQFALSITIFIVASIFVNDVNKSSVFIMTSICSAIVNLRCMLIYILQGTNRMKENAQVTIMEKIFYCCLILLFLILGMQQYKLLIFADLMGKFISLLYSMYFCKDIVFRTITSFYLNIGETIKNINVGIKLMIANIASLLIIGIIRFGIEQTWDVATFGKVSLILSISNLMMIFINAVGIIMFPILRRTNIDKLPYIYINSRVILVMALLGMVIVYYPINIILSIWLPNYAESLVYMALIFPMCVYEGKMSLLTNTFLKTLRKEKTILFVNLLSVIVSLVTTLIFTFLLKNLALSVVSIMLLLAFRSILAEILLWRIFNISLYKDVCLEISMTLVFVLSCWFISTLFSVTIYLFAYIVYLAIKKKDIASTFVNVKKLVRG